MRHTHVAVEHGARRHHVEVARVEALRRDVGGAAAVGGSGGQLQSGGGLHLEDNQEDFNTGEEKTSGASKL